MADAHTYDRTMGWMLLVDTCGSTGGIAVAQLLATGLHSQQPKLIAHQQLSGRQMQELLMTAISEALQASGLRPADLDYLAVVTGPGSFTGIRIGLAAMKGLAESLAIPIVAISRLALLAAQAGDRNDFQAWIDAGREDVFVGQYHRGKCVSEAIVHGADAVAALSPGVAAITMEPRLLVLYPGLRLVPEPGFELLLTLAAAAVLAGDFADAALLDANYLRVPDAELHRLAAVTRLA